MPFIVQCPHHACRKYMLLEDEVQGQVVSCLVCSQEIHLPPPEGAAADEEVVDLEEARQESADVGSAPATPPAEPQEEVFDLEEIAGPESFVRPCPNCRTPLQLSTAQQGQWIECPQCGEVSQV